MGIRFIPKKECDVGLARNGVLDFGKKKLPTPFLWFGLSNRESVVFQKTVFESAMIEGIMANAYDLMFQDRTGSRTEMVKELSRSGLVVKCDSGGYQILKRGKKIDRSKVLRFQEDLNCDLMVQLDYPILGSDPRELKKKHIDKTLNNLEYALKTANRPERIVPTIHGHDSELLRYQAKKNYRSPWRNPAYY